MYKRQVTDGDGDTAEQSVAVNTVAGPLFNDAPSGGSSVVTTDEGNIPGMGSQHETSATQPFGAATDGSFKMELHGADATVSIGGTELKAVSYTHLDMGTSKLNGKNFDVKRSGWYAALLAEYKLESCTPGLLFWYSSVSYTHLTFPAAHPRSYTLPPCGM